MRSCLIPLQNITGSALNVKIKQCSGGKRKTGDFTMSNEINKGDTIVFLTGYVIATLLCEIILLGYHHSFGIIGFLLLGIAGIKLAILYGYLTHRGYFT